MSPPEGRERDDAQLVPLSPFATWQAERAIGDHDRNTLRLRLEFEPGATVWLNR